MCVFITHFQIVRDYNTNANKSSGEHDQYKRSVNSTCSLFVKQYMYLFTQLVKFCILYTFPVYSVSNPPPTPRNYYVSPLSSDQFRAVMGYIKNIHNGSLDKIKPQGELQGQAHNRGGLKRS